ncbi:MAG: Holliday junction resolvase RuvX [Muribaculaceae bacterium]|nr:Holliday junction resolvase RuvX [Muribaculaceae bacterium]
MGRLMAIDFGRKRCGIAVTDPLRIVANGLDTVSTADLIGYISHYLGTEAVDGIIVGMPRTVTGEESESMCYLRPVIDRLAKSISPVPVVFYDERFTSVLAHRAMVDGGMKKVDRRDKAVVDKISAAIILNDYLNSRQYSESKQL